MSGARMETPRRRLEAAIEQAIEALDRLDGDADMETMGDDDLTPYRLPTLLGPSNCEDDEPSLAALNCIGTFTGKEYANTRWGTYSQLNWSGGGEDDREHDAGDAGEEDADPELWDLPEHRRRRMRAV